jgi:hypothetical protein
MLKQIPTNKYDEIAVIPDYKMNDEKQFHVPLKYKY